jgi:hypothetical protein
MRKTVEQEEEEKEEEQEDCVTTCQNASKIACTCRCGGVNHGKKSLMRMDRFFEVTEEKRVAAPVAITSAMIKCDDCNKLVPEEELKVWLAPVAVEEYEGEQDPVYMCKRCTKTFLNDNKEYAFENLLYTVKAALTKYNQPILEKWK